MSSIPLSLVRRLWGAIDDGIPLPPGGLLPGDVVLDGPRVTLPAGFDVTGLAIGAVACATLAAAQLLALRHGARDVPGVRVDSREASAAFAAEGRFTPVGWERPPLWDPIAGNYRAADGWIRLHTNYPSHRAAVERVLGARDRATVEERVSALAAERLEQAVVAAGGAAAALRTREQWLATEAGAATAAAPAVATAWTPGARVASWAPRPELPFAGVRVLDLTRVIAGPVCTRFLAGYGADVLRVDPPGFAEVPPLLPETTLGKRTAALDLATAAGRARLDALIAGADVLVCGLRAGALERRGYSDERLRALNPDLVVARLNAYGWSGPWRERRGFDSLVQLSCGISAGETAPGSAPGALPVQALDHATGWLLGAAIARALAVRLAERRVATIRASLVGTANLLFSLPVSDEPADPRSLDDVPLVERMTAWGPALATGPAARIDGAPQAWAHEAGPLGRHEAEWR
ncbi:CoA transferase [Microbacterium sp. No. 7]|uniref:CoA transferase n=1 Tax=Microbacterium sp. No. 7 TaxID=1714373 RepID=UPI0006D135AB|nr:CoA transferase [Microbacterium sp. No. 7]ALJ20535.1 hypothetical protein AOA12_11725 [Microbacterium sp. No. 7]